MNSKIASLRNEIGQGRTRSELEQQQSVRGIMFEELKNNNILVTKRLDTLKEKTLKLF